MWTFVLTLFSSFTFSPLPRLLLSHRFFFILPIFKHTLSPGIVVSLQLATVGNDDLLGRPSGLGAVTLDLLHHIHALDHDAKHHVTLIEPRGLHRGDKELGSVGVGTSIGHRHDSWSGVLQRKVLVLELAAVDGLTPGAVVVGEVTALAHEVGDHAVERGPLVADALFAGAQRPEVLRRLGNHVGAQLGNRKEIRN